MSILGDRSAFTGKGVWNESQLIGANSGYDYPGSSLHVDGELGYKVQITKNTSEVANVLQGNNDNKEKGDIAA